MSGQLPPADCEAIRQVIYRYCRGIDRSDRAALESCYWPDGHDDHGSFAGTVPEFIDTVLAAIRDMPTVHMIGNVLIEPGDGPDHALVESYVQATHRIAQPDGSRIEWTLLARYLDRFERRNGEWRIFKRFLAVDHEQTLPLSPPATHFVARAESHGGKHPADPVYTWLLKH